MPVPGAPFSLPGLLHLSQDPNPSPSPPVPVPGAPAHPLPRRCHRCARHSSEPAPREWAGPFASGGLTGAGESQWRSCIAPPLPSDWSAPEGRGQGLGALAGAELSLCSRAARSQFFGSARFFPVCRRCCSHGPVSDGLQTAGELSEGWRGGRSHPWRRLDHGGRGSPASWRPEPRTFRVSAPSGPGPLPLAAPPGGSPFPERARRGGDRHGRGKPGPEPEGKWLDGRRLCLQGLLPSVGDEDTRNESLPGRLERSKDCVPSSVQD